MTYEEEQELLNLTRQNNFLLRQIWSQLNNQNTFDIDVLANLFAGIFNRK
jgi:hypothetical protein